MMREANIETIELEKLKQQMEIHLGNDFARQLRFNLYDSGPYQDIALRIERQMFGEKRVDEFENHFRYPASWWQHFKEECFPKFLLRKFPTVWKTHTQKTNLNTFYEFPKAYRADVRELSNFITHSYIERLPANR